MTAPIVHITPAGPDLQAQLDHARECVIQMGRLNELMVSELAEARVELDKLKAQPVQELSKRLEEAEDRLDRSNDRAGAWRDIAVASDPVAQPVQPSPIDAEFPELPRPDRNAWPHGFHDLYTAQQMRDYTQQATAPILAKLATQVALVEKCIVSDIANRLEKT